MAKRGRKTKEVVTPPEPETTITHFNGIPMELYDRAKKIGLTAEQIQSLGTAENVKAHCDRISPQTNPDSLPKVDVPVAKQEPVKSEGWVSAFPIAKDDINAEKLTIERVVRKLNIRFNNPGLKTITKTVVYDCRTKQVTEAEYEIEKG